MTKINTMKRVKLISVKDAEGNYLCQYAPNFIGATRMELLAKAEAIAKANNTTVKVTYWEK
jgi:hypothetical protein